MVYIGNRSWQITIQLEKMSGFWPYQSKVKNYPRMALVTVILLLVVFGLLTSIIKHWNDDITVVIENFIELTPIILLITKLITIFFVEKKRREILERIARHYDTIVDEDEVQILCNSADKGLMLTILSTGSLGFATMTFLISSYVRMILLYFFGEGDLSKFMPVPIDFLIDDEKYFYHILLAMLVALGVSLTVQFSFDLTLFIIVRHACALFEIVKLRVARASNIFEQCGQNKKFSDSDEDKAYEILTSAVDLHNDAFELTQLIDETYNVPMFIILLLNAIVIAPFPASVMQHIHDKFQLFRRGMSFFIYPVHFYVLFLQGQLVIDHSSAVFDACYEFQWYNTSKRCREVIQIMMSRSLEPSRLTGGNMFYLSMETYSVMLKTAISYISMFATVME